MSKAKLVREPFCALAVIAAGRMSPGYGWSLNRTELNSIQFNANKSSQTEKKCQIEQAEERSKISEREREGKNADKIKAAGQTNGQLVITPPSLGCYWSCCSGVSRPRRQSWRAREGS